jgi:hypothetical protein
MKRKLYRKSGLQFTTNYFCGICPFAGSVRDALMHYYMFRILLKASFLLYLYFFYFVHHNYIYARGFVVVARWSNDLFVIFITFGILRTTIYY